MKVTTRLKKSGSLIRMLRPQKLSCDNLIYPIFVREDGKSYDVPSMKGQKYYSLEKCITVCGEILDLGIPAVMIFGLLTRKNADGSIALHKDGFHVKIFKRLKREFGDGLAIISNVCLCDFTTTESCVYMENGKVLNEKTSKMLGKIAVVHAEAGADVVAPAAMADGQVRHIRLALDEEGLEDVPIMSYVKTDSCLFKPFFKTVSIHKEPRTGVDSSKFRTDIINHKMYMAKVDLDISEGADIIIVKPALTNLDLILRVKQKYPNIPIAAYQVSGEYAMIKAAEDKGYLEKPEILMETLNSIKRAGSDMILTYDALNAAKLL